MKLIRILFFSLFIMGFFCNSHALHPTPKLGQLQQSLTDLNRKLLSLSKSLSTLKTTPAHTATSSTHTMPSHPHDIYISLVSGYIEAQAFEDPARAAVVTAANEPLSGGGGVDAAIWAAAGTRIKPDPSKPSNLRQACDELPGGSHCPTGDARITSGINLDPMHIIHAVGPTVPTTSPNLLKNAYINSLKLATQKELTAIAFPSISIGIFGYPLPLGINEAVDAIFEYLSAYHQTTTLCDIRLVVWKQDLNNQAMYNQRTLHYLESNIIIDVTNESNIVLDKIKSALSKTNPRVKKMPKPKILIKAEQIPPGTNTASWTEWNNEPSWRIFKYTPTH